MRDCFLRAVVLWGAGVWFATELLSTFDAVRPVPLLVCWILVVGAVALALRRTAPPFVRPRVDYLVAACSAGCAVIVALTGIEAAFSPPNSADAMAYHMPRVLYWAEQGSVRFFPANYLNQIILQPFAEYVMLQSYVITGGDHWINFGQWFAAAGSMLAVSCIAGEWGANARGQAMAAFFCATIPAGILASSGAKNDYILALWLAIAVYFTLRARKSGGLQDAGLLGLALGLALLTKATAYLFAPWPVLAILSARGGRIKARGAVLAMGCALLVNAPQYVRNYGFNGSVLGSDSAFGDQRYRWPNEAFGWKPTASNALRNASEQLGARREQWNTAVYHFVLAAHRILGIAPDDPANTWPGATYAAPKNANHEADSPNLLHLAILFALAWLLAWRAIRGRERERAAYALSLAFGFIAFCAYLKWQPFMARLFLPLFVLGAPLVSSIRPLWIQVALCLMMLDTARRPVLENWVRPLKGPNSVLSKPRDQQYFSDMTQWREDWPAYPATVVEVARTRCSLVGVDTANFQLEYPLLALLRERNSQIQFEHTGVENASNQYRQPVNGAPCVVVCLHCVGDEHRLSLYRQYPRMIAEGSFAIFEREP